MSTNGNAANGHAGNARGEPSRTARGEPSRAARGELVDPQAPAERGVPAWTDFMHTGPGTLAGRFMRRFWHPVYRAVDLQPGRAVPVKIMSEDFTLYRGVAPPPQPSPSGGRG